MLKTIKDYFEISIQYIRINLLSLLQYRADVIIGSIAVFLLQGVGILSIWVIMINIPDINGWNFEQILFIYALAVLVRSIWHSFFMGLLSLSWYVRHGVLDLFMTRPLPVLFQLIHDEWDDDAWGETILGIILLATAWRQLQIPATGLNIFILVIFLLSGTIIYNALTMIGSSLSFWTINNDPFIRLQSDIFELVKFPLDIYSPVLKVVLTFILPIGFISFYPAQFFLQKENFIQYSYFAPLVAILLQRIALIFWRFGLNHYQSTGS
jgi:ABC-2 type transport system permease protein